MREPRENCESREKAATELRESRERAVRELNVDDHPEECTILRANEQHPMLLAHEHNAPTLNTLSTLLSPTSPRSFADIDLMDETHDKFPPLQRIVGFEVPARSTSMAAPKLKLCVKPRSGIAADLYFPADLDPDFDVQLDFDLDFDLGIAESCSLDLNTELSRLEIQEDLGQDLGGMASGSATSDAMTKQTMSRGQGTMEVKVSKVSKMPKVSNESATKQSTRPFKHRVVRVEMVNAEPVAKSVVV